jgi:type VI secretion system protein ImpI/type VI secretion system protein
MRTAVPPPGAAAPAGADDLLAVFLDGAGLAGQPRPAAPEATMRALGAAFRSVVSGLRQALIARAEIKGEFRIEQTMIRPRGNNPLKFSADDEDALAALLGTGRRTDMGPAEAVADALRDMRLHELAAMAAMQAAVRELLAQFDPAAFRSAAEKDRGLIPGKHKSNAWDRFEAKHGEVTKALSDDFDSVFGKAFARAYEQALHEVTEREGEP